MLQSLFLIGNSNFFMVKSQLVMAKPNVSSEQKVTHNLKSHEFSNLVA